MMNETNSRGKIARGTEGIGAVTPLMIEERAREIACSDGRAHRMILTGLMRVRN
jgi:hypothetical protein